MSFVCVLYCVVSGVGPDIVTAHSGRSVLVCLSSFVARSLLLHLEESDPQVFRCCQFRGVKSYTGG